jgi:hypothetical protein
MADSFEMVATAVTATNAVTMLSLGSTARSVVRSLNLYNAHTANTAAIVVSVTRGSTAAEYTLVNYTQVTCQQSIQALSQPVVLNPLDSLRVKCDPVDSVDVVVSHLRIT